MEMNFCLSLTSLIFFYPPQVLCSSFKTATGAPWRELHLPAHFFLMAVASVTMFCACFSNGMSIMLPWKVNAPWKRENVNFLRGPLEIVGGLSFSLKTHLFAKTHQLPQESWTSFTGQTNWDGPNAFKEMQWAPSAPQRRKKREKREAQCAACLFWPL